jgi:hypothetical protein
VLIDPERVWNVVPEQDLLPHRDGMDCECRPTLEEVSSGWLIVHHAWDCREYFEES